ncbi:hypothetical protein PpBr36_02600, partial [Pyricularia pennisetigena]|uniref:hypothetical protein n=1 Tax=Pyricularia pennisetigena TaxID=1578925 RepID=UPI001154F605
NSQASWQCVSLSDVPGHDRRLAAGKSRKLGYGEDAGSTMTASFQQRRGKGNTVRTMNDVDAGYSSLDLSWKA